MYRRFPAASVRMRRDGSSALEDRRHVRSVFVAAVEREAMLRRGLPFSVMALLMAGFSASAVAQSVPLPSQSMLARYGLVRAWWGQATLNPTRERVRYLVVDEDTLYVQSELGIVTAFDAESGRRLWAIRLGRSDLPSLPLVSNNDTVLVVVGIHLYALNKLDGEPLWELRLPGYPSTSPGVDDRQIYVGTLDGSVYAFDLRRIRQYYEERLLPQFSAETINWRYQAAREVTTPPVSTGRSVKFASLDQSLYAIGTLDRKLLWQFETDEPVSAPLAVGDGRVYLASQDFNFYCINAETGQVRWHFITGLPILQAPRVIGDDVFIIPDHGGLFCLSADTGREKWPADEQVVRFLAASKSTVYAADELGNVLLLNRKTGERAGVLPLRGYKVQLSNDRTDRLFLATTSGRVICIREQAQEFPLYYMHPERRPILPEFASESAPGAKPPVPPTN